ncbi:YggS family pyridoxal phosphate-dependent enzyme [bacterium]|nr:MAG: YggS family pyridoxal phosphate-dependent enzyme [bacterium]
MESNTTRHRVHATIQRIKDACRRVGRKHEDIQLIAVSKTYGVEEIKEALNAGIHHIGENKVQEAKEKLPILQKDKSLSHVQWHYIGHLQTNKVRQAVELFDIIHSVDSLRLAAEIDRRSYTKDKIMPVLIQVNTSREKPKYGIDPDDTLELVKQVSELKNLKIKGLMTIGALTAATANDTVKIRSYFKKLRELKEFIADQNIPNVDMHCLSMGMSNDFEIAIEEGATHLRIGTAIFGKRKRAVKSLLPAASNQMEEKS